MSKKMSKRTGKRLGILALLVVLTGAGCFAVSRKSSKKETASSAAYKEEVVRKGSVSTGITESGTIEYGTTEQVFEVAEITEVSSSDTESSGSTSTESTSENSASGNTAAAGAMGSTAMAGQTGSMGMSGTTSSSGSSSTGETTTLEVEEVYAASGQTLAKGDKILKITEDSIEDYRSELEAAVASAKLLVSQEEINAETKKAEADYNHQMYLTEGETAQETYEATVTSLEEKITDIEEEIEDTDDEDELEELEAELKIAQNNLTTGSLEAKQTYENAMTNYKYADQLYEIDTNGLEDDLNDAKDTLEECQENLENFESQIGDGIIYAEYDGTVTEVAYAAGDNLTNEAAVVTFTDPDNVTMTVAVSQDDISNAAVGSEVSVYLTAYDGEPFAGTVSAIAASATTGSSTVSYDVTAKLTGDISKVYSGMTGEVTIAGRTEEDTLYISNKAVHLDGTRSWVKVLEDDGTITETDITTGFSNGNIVAVESGLEEGQTVLIESQVTQ